MLLEKTSTNIGVETVCEKVVDVLDTFCDVV